MGFIKNGVTQAELNAVVLGQIPNNTISDLELSNDPSDIKSRFVSSMADNTVQLTFKASQLNLDNTNTNVGLKADISYVDAQVQALASGSPKGTYETQSLLASTFPTGNANTYVVTADGNWYYWNGTIWAAGGVYQSSGLADKSVIPIKTSFFSINKNLFNKDIATAGYYVREDTGALSVNASMSASDFIEVLPDTNYFWNTTRRYAWYDVNKAFISGGFADLSTSKKSPINAKYIRATLDTANINTFQIEKGYLSTEYQAYLYGINPSVIPTTPFVTKQMLNKGIVDVTIADFITTGKNLFDKSRVTTGYVVNELTGVIYANASYFVSEFMPVLGSTSYTENFGYYLAFYDINKTFIIGLGNGTSPRTITTPANAEYVRLSCNVTYLDAFQFEKGLTSTEYQTFGYVISKGLYQIATLGTSFAVEGVITPTVNGLVGQEINIYFENILNDSASKYLINVVCDIGMQLEDKWPCVPIVAGTYPMTIEIYKDYSLVSSFTTSVVVKGVSVGTGVNKVILIVGDSTTANAIAVTKLNDNFNTDVMDITTIGTLGVAPNKHEGRSGWTVSQYCTDVASPFVFSGVFNFSQYMATNVLSTPDYVIINLGINDTFSYTDDATLNAKIATILPQYQTMIDSIKAYNTNVKVGLAITIPPAYDQNAFGKMYNSGQTRWRYKRNNYLWTKALINQFKGKEAQGIYLVPINVNIDTKYNFGLETLPVNARNTKTVESIISNGNVHPDVSGYWQIADVYWYWLKSFES